MLFLRSFIHLLWMLCTVVPWAVVVLVASLFIRGSALWFVAARWMGWAIDGARVILGIRVRMHGFENLPTDPHTPVILLCKHQSTFETFLLPKILPRALAFVFKKELLWIPFFGWAMGRLDMIHIDRSQGVKAFSKVVDRGQELLNQGMWVVMFPEGTRIPRGQVGKYKSGGARLAVATGVPIIPVAVTSAKCWPRKAFVKKPGTVDVSFGPLIQVQDRTADEVLELVKEWIEAEMQRLDPDAYPTKPTQTVNASAPHSSPSPSSAEVNASTKMPDTP